MLDRHVDLDRHPLGDAGYVNACCRELERTGVLVLVGFLQTEAVQAIVAEFAGREDDAFYADSTHNVWLTEPDPELGPDHVFNRQVVSTKGLIADDAIAPSSPLKVVYNDARFRSFVATVVGLDAVHPYADALSSVNMHFHRDGQELGWHFDNSAFAVTALIQAPEAGGTFEFVSGARDSTAEDQGFERVEAVLDGLRAPERLALGPGDLVVFRGRDALHRVTPSRGDRTRLLAVFAFNERPDIALSDSAMRTFYGRVV